MKIQWQGSTKCTLSGKKATVAIDHETSTKADVYFYSNFDDSRKEPEHAKILDWPGEYEVKGVNITAFQGKTADEKDNLIFYFEIDRIKVCHLGNCGPNLTSEMIQEISETDVLLVPVNNGSTLSAKQAHEIIEQIEPRVVIPMGFEPGDESIQNFIKEMSIQNPEPTSSYETKNRSTLPDDRTEYVILTK